MNSIFSSQSFIGVWDFLQHDTNLYFSLQLFRHHCKEVKVCNALSLDEVETCIVGNLCNMDVSRNIIIKKNFYGEFTRLYKTHIVFIKLS